jgi:hypothetical protein
MLADIVKIHCLTHRADFPMSRTSRIVVCKEGAEEHVLCDNFPYSGAWIYCCNCQSFISWDTDRAEISIRQCPFCLSSQNPRLYACDHCAVTMVDYDDPTLRKHHTILTWGMPQPACPACHQFPGASPRTHFCRSLEISLATARSVCPFCGMQTGEAATDGASAVTAKLDAALADAESRARDADERRRLAEDAARKEITLRAEAEQAARELEEERLQARAAARKEAEMRAEAEMLAREAEEKFTSDFAQAQAVTVSRKDKVSIALLAALAVALLFALIVIVYSMASLM